jgi:3-hydroxymyristoyl/3-hydroxydecanoyl-(acyl carrier protein) dehydratase
MNLPPFDMVRPGPDEARFDLHPGPDAAAFRGHFPGMPVLPGVVQIDWAMQLAHTRLGLGCRAAQDFQVKFRRLLRPGGALTLHLRIDRAKRVLLFDYWQDGEPAASGRVRLEQA